MNLIKLISNFFRRKKISISKLEAEDYYKFVDTGYLASWNKVDGEYINKVTTAARLGYLEPLHADKLFREIEDSITRKYEDKTIHYDMLEPLEATIKYDRITDYGLTLFCGRIVGKSLPLISHMGIGDGVGDTYEYQDTLFAEKTRYAFGADGYINALGRTLRFHMTYDIMMAQATFTEIGLFNNPDLGVGPLIARSVFNPGIDHDPGVNYITGSYLISTLSA